ncbi:MAG TPA: hypothetical protein VFW44_19895 [Bryobacteraceae bacterium]|nr:hypothetical protein [Bryobacteraceae bacterium]
MSKFAQGICVFVLAVAGQASLRAQPNIPAQVTRTTAVVGIAEGQVAQLNALNPGVAAPAATGALCTGVLAFVGDDGKILKTANVTVAPGASQALTLDAVKDLALGTAERKQVRATITIAAAPASTNARENPLHPMCNLIGTLEIFNAIDGHTQVTLGTVHEIPHPVATPGA